MNRREFLTLAASLPWLGLPYQLAQAANPARVLVLVRLAGGNDGFNTLIPHADPLYYEARPQVAIPKHQVIDIGQGMAMNPYLKVLKPWWDKGQLAWIQGVGYSQPELSHFRSNDIWETGSNANQTLEEGWLAQTLSPVPGLHGIVMGEEMGPLLGKDCHALAMQSPQVFLSQVSLVDDIPPSRPTSALAHITSVQHQLYNAGQQIGDKLAKPADLGVNFSTSEIGRDLESVAKMILSGVSCQTYLVTLNGFDTHSDQQVAQNSLLHHLAGALDSFAQAMQQGGRWNEVLVMTYSEFGRRVEENHGKGTDHGTASVQLVMGGKVYGGIYGDAPRLNELDENGNVHHTVDFKKVYGTVLQHWLAQRNPWQAQGVLSFV